MKKLHLILLTVFLNLTFFSCTPNSVEANTPAVMEDCCGDDIPPPPPPPPTGEGG